MARDPRQCRASREIGIEQSIGDHEDIEKNHNWSALLDRHERQFGSRSDSTMIALLYDQGRAAIRRGSPQPVQSRLDPPSAGTVQVTRLKAIGCGSSLGTG